MLLGDNEDKKTAVKRYRIVIYWEQQCFDLNDADTCEAVSKTSVPILIIHGDKDIRAPLSMAYRIYNSCQSKKEIYVVLGAEHTECYRTDPEKYEKTVSEFIEKNLP